MKGDQGTAFTALVLAGVRGPSDPFAEALGCRRKALVPVAGVPMLVRVVRSLRAAPQVGAIVISVDHPAVLDDVAELRELMAAGEVVCVRSGTSPSTSVLEFLSSRRVPPPVLVTTADHPLLTVAMLEYFCTAARRSGADVAVAAVAASEFRCRYPGSRRTFIQLRGDGFSGANLFGFLTPRAARVAEFWRRAEAFRKRPWMLASLFGTTSLALLLLRRLDLDAATARASRAAGARISVMPMPYPESAIDVDSSDDLALASRILSERVERVDA